MNKNFKILIVDDDYDILEILSDFLRKKFYYVNYAANGNEAFKMLEKHEYDLVLLDIIMPEVDGFEFLKKLNEMNNPLTRKTIILSAHKSTEDMRKAMNLGAFDFLCKPIDFEELEISIKNAKTHIDAFKNVLESHCKLKSYEKELEIASTIQKSMVPLPPFPQQKEFAVYAEMVPAKVVGGDFYDFFFIDKTRFAFIIGDVTGKGIPSALYMAKVCTLLKTVAMNVGYPGECLRKINNQLMMEKKNNCDLGVTIFWGLLNINTGVLEYSCGGHHAPYIASEGKIEKIPQKGGIPLSYFEDKEYEVGRIQLRKEDTIFCSTDGVTEAENLQGDQFDGDEKRFLKYLEVNHKKPLEAIAGGLLDEIKAFCQGVPQSDDITILALRYN